MKPKNENWLQFLFVLKAAALKHQISKLCPQIQSIISYSFCIYGRPLAEINVMASFCVLNLRVKFRYLMF